MAEVWRRCSSCKKDILAGQTYYVCSVSTCQGKVTNYVFCSVACWDAHVPTERHRPESAGAIERKAPRPGEFSVQDPAPRKVMPSPSASGKTSVEDEILVVVSKVKKYILERSGMNTSAGVFEALTEKIKRHCDAAIEEARRQGRKTVMDRDVH